LLDLLFNPEDEDDIFLRSVALTFKGLHGVTPQKKELLLSRTLLGGGLLEKVTAYELVEKCPVSYRIRRLATVFTRACVGTFPEPEKTRPRYTQISSEHFLM
jgi:hypothetical protein